MIDFQLTDRSCYIRTSWMLAAETELRFLDASKIRVITDSEVKELTSLIRKRNVFARHSWENNFYLQRMQEFSNRTIIEVYKPGDPKEMYAEAERVADLLEKITVLSTTLTAKKDLLHRKLGISIRPREEINFIFGAEFRYLRSRSKPEPQAPGITINQQLLNRFEKCGFPSLYKFCLSDIALSERVTSSLNWLFESRIEPLLTASVVKTAIALESLLIFSESESLARSLSERVAFILTSSPENRERLSKIVKKFYEVRSGVVHGSKKKARALTPDLLEAMDRLILLLYLVLAANPTLWTSVDDLGLWCERQKWGNPATDIHIPFAQSYLANAMQLAEKSLEKK